MIVKWSQDYFLGSALGEVQLTRFLQFGREKAIFFSVVVFYEVFLRAWIICITLISGFGLHRERWDTIRVDWFGRGTNE